MLNLIKNIMLTTILFFELVQCGFVLDLPCVEFDFIAAIIIVLKTSPSSFSV